MAWSGMVKNLALSGLIAGIASIGAMSQSSSSSPGKLSAADRTFMMKAARGGKAEVELGQLAQQKASSSEVKEFGERMVTDHSQANEKLKQVATEKGVNLPDSLNAKDTATKSRLEKLSGAAFDRAYMQDMVKDHTQDVAEFQKEAKNGNNPEVKNFASQTVTTLEQHLKEAKEIAPKVTSKSAAQ